jgi:hypothetical protein
VKAPVLLSVSGTPLDFEPLFAEAAARKLRVGWLEFDGVAEPPPTWAVSPFSGVFRVALVGASATVTWKPRKGPAVLRDLIREQFLGADFVLVKGSELYPVLRRDGELWLLRESGADRERRLTLDELLARLRKPELRFRESKGKGL